MPRKGPKPSKLTFHCVSPANEPGKHGSNPQFSLKGTPFHTESSNIWVGYRDSPGKKYLGVFPSLQEMVGICRANAISKTNNAFPRFLTHSSDNDKWQKDESGNFIRKACCTACSKENGACEALTLEFIPVTIPPREVVKVYLLAYNFYLKGEKMVALVWHSNQGIHFFQKTDGSLSRSLSLHSNHICTTRPVPLPSRGESIPRDSSDPRTPDGDFDASYPNDSGDDSSLTDFDSVEPEVTKAPVTPRMSLRSSQSSLPQGSAIRVAVPSLPVPLPDHIPQSRKRGCVVLDLTEEDESPRVKKERLESPELLAHTVPYITPPTTHPSAPSNAPSEDRSSMTRSARENLANDYGRMCAQIAQERSMRVFELPKMIDFKRRMIQAVRTADESALYRIYGEVQVFFATID
ncbi:hypothetical protein VTO58DRAFT_101064 [Aureobasidium pullulans]|nr:hypothetical protein JADG_010800 [Aureobasidium pullulans]